MKLLAIALGFAAVLLVAVAAGLAPALAQSVPGNVRAVDGANPGEATVSWSAVEYAAYYRIGWVSMERFETVRSSGQNWLNAFAFTDVDNSGQAAHTLTDLAPGDRYAFIIGVTGSRFGIASWSEWAYLTLAEAPTSCPTDTGEPAPPQSATPTPAPTAAATPAPSATPALTPTLTPTPSPTPASTHTPAGRGDYDADNDGLIEISNLAQLNAIRYDLDGNGVTPAPGYAAAFPNALVGMGCPERCAGYELTTNLEFDTNGNGEADAGDDYWNDGAGWVPIGSGSHQFVGSFDGNGYTIANLFIDLGDDGPAGLIGHAGRGSSITDVGLISVAITAGAGVGSLVGQIDYGAIISSYATGTVSGTGSHISHVGGLVGSINEGTISDSYAAVDISSVSHASAVQGIGGLVGVSYNATVISSSYAEGSVSGGAFDVGGLVGMGRATTISNSYATGNVTCGNSYSERARDVGGLVGEGGSISDSYATGDVTCGGDGPPSENVGGLVGFRGNIDSSYATGNVSGGQNVGGLAGKYSEVIASYATGSVSGDSNVGGLVGHGGNISGSYATGNVSGGGNVGGLVGHSEHGDINGSYATGNVSGGGNVGGLVGHGEHGDINGSYATGSVSGVDGAWHVGGLVGHSQVAIGASYAAGSVTGDHRVGGLVGFGDGGAISNSYAKGSVSGSGDDIGGLVGRNSRGSIAASYAIGPVSTSGDTAYIGGLVGYDEGGEIIASYWDTQTTGQVSPGYGGVGKTTAELQSPTGATGIYADWDAGAWDFGSARQYPVLKYDGMDVTRQR